MNEILPYYHKVNPTTWAYVSSLLMIGLYFKFSRFWSVRNLDLVLLILLAPGLLLVNIGHVERRQGQVASADLASTDLASQTPDLVTYDVKLMTLLQPPPGDNEPSNTTSPLPADDESSSLANQPLSDDPMGELLGVPEQKPPPATPELLGARAERLGYLWLFVTGGLLLVRLLLDSTMVRRPLLEPNLSPGGLTFIGCSLFVFLMGNMASNPAEAVPPRPHNSPGFALLQELPTVPNVRLEARLAATSAAVAPPAAVPHGTLTKVIVILAHLAIVIGVIGVGYRHFDNLKMGVGAATLYLLLPYTAQMTGNPEHVVPAACLTWAVLCYRRPMTSGWLLGLAGALGYYPLFLLPLWFSFYWQRGLMRFLIGVLTTLTAMALLLAWGSADMADYIMRVRAMLGVLPFRWRAEDLGGIWALGWDPVYRVPMLTAFVALAGSFALWPAQKNLGTLLSCSAAVMLAAQFWHGNGGGLYMAWYLPLLLLTVFRPNLEDRVALSVLGDGWFPRKSPTLARAA